MIDVNGVYFEPREKVTELTHTAIYEGKDGYRYIVKRDTRNQAIIKLEQKRAEVGLSIRKSQQALVYQIQRISTGVTKDEFLTLN